MTEVSLSLGPSRTAAERCNLRYSGTTDRGADWRNGISKCASDRLLGRNDYRGCSDHYLLRCSSGRPHAARPEDSRMTEDGVRSADFEARERPLPYSRPRECYDEG